MTSVIEEINLRTCIPNALFGPNFPFIKKGNNQPIYNENYNANKENPLKILAPDDTFHDLAKDRTGYNAQMFVENGIANYLMTGQIFPNNFISLYKDYLNYPEYSQKGLLSGTSYENKVAESFELTHGLQIASITITYDEIVNGFLVANENKNNGSQGIYIFNGLKQKIINSNGSINIKPSLSENLTFEMYTSRFGNDQNRRNVAMLKISHFIKWYLHSTDLKMMGSLKNANFKVTLPSKIRMLFDAGVFQMGEIFGVQGSGGTPYITGASLLDSASTSSNLLDPTIPIVYEKLNENYIIPILSNYFSCNEIFMGYLVNPKKEFGVNGMYCFSLIVIKIPTNGDANDKKFVDAINIVRTVPTNQLRDINSSYYKAISSITEYVNSYPAKVARYYFGEVEKDILNEFSKCGTCGAGVPYLGKVFSVINNEYTITQNKKTISGKWDSQQLKAIQDRFNTLKRTEKLNSRIPIADARILRLFCNNAQFANITGEDILLLYKILADYKRTGDYQQVYSVLKAIIESGDTNTEYYTFSTGDELAALLARLSGLPTILQTAIIGKTTLYRCDYFMANEAQRLQVQINSDKKVIFTFNEELSANFQSIFLFLNQQYINICQLRDQLITLIPQIDQFDKLLMYNAIYILSRLIELSNNLYQVKQIDFNGKSYTTLVDQISFINSIVQNMDNLNGDEIKTTLKMISHISNNPIFTLMEYIEQKFPNLSILNINSTNVEHIFEPLTDNEKSTKSFNRPSLNLIFVKGQSKEKIINKLRKYSVKPSVSGRGVSRIVGQYDDDAAKSRAVKNFNDFINILEPSEVVTTYNVSDISMIAKNIQDLTNEYEKNIMIQLQSIKCDQQQLNNNMNLIKSIYPAIKGGSNKSTFQISKQWGGNNQANNRYYIYASIQNFVLSLFNKCNNYMNDVTNNIDTTQTLMECFDKINLKYDVNQFCFDILYEYNDDIDENIGNEGIIPLLKDLASEFTYGDLDETNQTPDSPVTVAEMLNYLGLQNVQWLLFMLTAFTDSNGNQDLSVRQDLCSTIGLDPNTIPPLMKDIYNRNNPVTPNIFSIASIALFNYFYNGSNSVSYYTELFDHLNNSNIYQEFQSQFNLNIEGLSSYSSYKFLTGDSKYQTGWGTLNDLLVSTLTKMAVICNIPLTQGVSTISQTSQGVASGLQKQVPGSTNDYTKYYNTRRRGGKNKIHKTRKLPKTGKKYKNSTVIKIKNKKNKNKTIKKR
jgi:hypothetical protein